MISRHICILLGFTHFVSLRQFSDSVVGFLRWKEKRQDKDKERNGKKEKRKSVAYEVRVAPMQSDVHKSAPAYFAARHSFIQSLTNQRRQPHSTKHTHKDNVSCRAALKCWYNEWSIMLLLMTLRILLNEFKSLCIVSRFPDLSCSLQIRTMGSGLVVQTGKQNSSIVLSQKLRGLLPPPRR